MKGCPTAGALAAHARGESEPALRSVIESHLARCERCRLSALLLRAPSAQSGREGSMEAEAPASDHLDPEDIFGFIEKSLNRGKLGKVEEHLDHCRQCVQDVALVLTSQRPASAAEEASLGLLAARGPEEVLRRLRAQIIASSPGPASRTRATFPRGRLLSAATALAGIAALIFLFNLLLLAPARSRRLAEQALAELVALRHGTGRLPLRYIPGFRKALVTRSGFDAADLAEEAIETRLRRAVDLAEGEFEPRLALGLFLLDRGDLAEAEAALRKAASIDPGSVAAANGLAVIYYERALIEGAPDGEWMKRGLALLEEARRRNPEDLQVSFNIGLVYEQLGMIKSAQEAWTGYLNKDSGSEWAQVAREHLEALAGR